MPINDLRSDHDVPRLQLLGDIRLGKPKTPNAPGQALPCFALRDATELTKKYGYPPKPTELHIVFPFNDIDMNLDDWHRLYGSGGIKCRGDGKKVDLMYNDNAELVIVNGVCIKAVTEGDQKYERGDTVPCGGYSKIYPRCKKCAGIAMVKVMIQEVVAEGILGFYRIQTRSKHGILNMRGAMEYAMGIAERADGHRYLAGIPFILSLKKEMKSVPMKDDKGKGYRARMAKYILSLKPDPTWVAKKMAAVMSRALATPDWAALPAPRRALVAPLDDTQQPTFSPTDAPAPPSVPPEGNGAQLSEPPPDTDQWDELFEDIEEGEFRELEEGDEPASAESEDDAEPHWIDDPETEKKFWLWVTNEGLTDKDVYAALGVETIEQYHGSKTDAVIAIEAYIISKIKGVGEPETPADVKTRLKQAATDSQCSGKPTDAQRGLLIGQLTDVLGSDDATKLFLAWLYDYPTVGFSRTMLSGPEVVAVLDELAPQKLDGKTYVPTNEKAVEVFKLMVRQAMIDKGQQEFDMPAQDELPEAPKVPTGAKEAAIPTELVPTTNLSSPGEFWMAVLANLKLNQTQALALVGVNELVEIQGTTFLDKYQAITRAMLKQAKLDGGQIEMGGLDG